MLQGNIYFLKAYSKPLPSIATYQDAVRYCEAFNTSLGAPPEDSLQSQNPVWINVVKKTYKDWKPDGEGGQGKQLEYTRSSFLMLRLFGSLT